MNNDDIKKLYEQYASWVFHRARSFLKNDEASWEAVQDIFVKILQSGHDFRGDSSPWTWIYRITTNHCLNLIRSKKTWDKVSNRLEQDHVQLYIESKDQKTEHQNQSVLINRQSFVKLLRDEDELTQKIIYHYFVEDMTQEEMEEVLQVSRKTIYKRLKKFTEKAREKL